MNGRAVTAVIAAALVVVAVVAVVVPGSGGGPSGGPSTSTAGTTGATRPAVPIASSVTTPGSTSVIVAMGNLADPNNTFWQLFVRRAGGSSWALRTPPGVADNGGLVVASSTSGALTAGFLTSARLAFSPVAQSSDGGITWSPGQLPSALVAVPDAMAAGTTPDRLALVSGSGGTVVVTSGDPSTWQPVVTSARLASSAPGCGLGAITAVAYDQAGEEFVGLSCDHGARVGVLAPGASSGTANGTRIRSQVIVPSPGTTRASGPTSVLRLERTAIGVAGMAGVGDGAARSLMAFWEDGTTGRWVQSDPLVVPAGWRVIATGVGGGAGSGEAVLLASGRRSRVEEIAGPGGSWSTLAGAPTGTGAVAVIGNETDAFAVSGSHLTVWSSSPGAAAWHQQANVTVPIQYGSSGSSGSSG